MLKLKEFLGKFPLRRIIPQLIFIGPQKSYPMSGGTPTTHSDLMFLLFSESRREILYSKDKILKTYTYSEHSVHHKSTYIT